MFNQFLCPAPPDQINDYGLIIFGLTQILSMLITFESSFFIYTMCVVQIWFADSLHRALSSDIGSEQLGILALWL